MMEVVEYIAAGWWTWMSAVTVQTAVLIAVVYALDRAVGERAGPQFRAAMWWVVMLKLVLPPTLTSPISMAQLMPTDEIAGAGVVAATESASTGGWLLAGFIAWAVGAAGWAATTILRYRRTRARWLTACDESLPGWLDTMAARAARRIGLSNVPRVIISAGGFSPAVVGIVRPAIVMPADAVRSASRVHIRHMLLHEMVHIRRHDPIVNAACLTLQAIYWFHPGVWLARARLSVLCEMTCDQAVSRLLGRSAPRYRQTLLQMARSLLERPAAHGSLAFMRRRSQIVQRLECLRRPRPCRPAWRRAATAATV
ncbi:MAG: M56 family metallopeptidase, partial [Phycisphaerales bacterium]|nr:M56 family metallopeptidase [Phycisphaerales bacterium]